MSVEKAIHGRWGATHSLEELVPVERLFTGLAKGSPPFPYVTFERQAPAAVERTSSGRCLETLAVLFQIWDADLDRALRVAEAIADAYANSEFDFTSGRVLDFQRRGERLEQVEHGVWQVTSEYQLRLSHSR